VAIRAETVGRRRRQAASSLLDRHIRWVLVTPAVLLILFLTIYPLGYSMWVNFVNYDFALPGHRWVALDNFKLVWSDPVARNALWVTLGLSAASVAVELVLGFAHAHAQLRPVRRRRPQMNR
jgi:multiple sugar transport system permease protein